MKNNLIFLVFLYLIIYTDFLNEITACFGSHPRFIWFFLTLVLFP